MQDNNSGFSRRSFLKTAGAAGLGAALTPFGTTPPAATASGPAADITAVPTRPFGKSGVDVPVAVLQGIEIRDIVVRSGDRDQYYRILQNK